ncbi:MAG TPA: universal stress protein [Chloroflexota bacterium]|jgi:nucleotide-binding universal stress UspA family protein
MTSSPILVPLDGSAESNAALPLARTLAKATASSVTLLRVMTHEEREATRDATSNLASIARELAGSGVTVESTVRSGRAAEEILEEIRERTPSLVVMRTHGRSGIERAVLGSVADQVLARCPVPIVLMRPGGRRITAIGKLLVPVDGSPGGAVALRTAIGLAQATSAAIKLVQICQPVAMHAAMSLDGGVGYYDPDWDDASLASAQAYVDALVKQLGDNQLTVEGHVSMAPSVAGAIVELADRDAADLVVMSTRALTGPARTLLGSVANAVVRTAPCPVVLVHRAESESPTTAEDQTSSTS